MNKKLRISRFHSRPKSLKIVSRIVGESEETNLLRVGELAVEDHGGVVNAASGSTHLELVGELSGQVVHDILQ